MTDRLPRLLPLGWRLRVQLPITLAGSEPEPDVAVVRRPAAPRTGHPEPADTGIVIEVADSTLRTDRREKGRLYAAAVIPVYWIVNVADGQVEVYADPDPAATPPAYRTRADYRPGDDVPITLDGQVAGTIPAGDLLP